MVQGRQLTPDEFHLVVRASARRDTSADEDGWPNDNPLWGHCAVVSLLAQDHFGGELLRVSLGGTEFESSGSHYFNKLQDGSEPDFTREQFGDRYPEELTAERRTREYVLSYGPTAERYKLFALRVVQELYFPSILLVKDDIFQRGFNAALGATCQKMKYGCVAMRKGGHIVATSCNQALPPLAHQCAGECIRLNIPSRTESMIGACSHAEEAALWQLARQGTPLSECELYVVSLFRNNLPWFRERPEFTCLRCAVAMYQSGVRGVNVPCPDGRWHFIDPESAVKTAELYALGARKLVRE